MTQYRIVIERCDTYSASVTVEAESVEAAITHVDSVLSDEGWDGLFPGNDGDYEECESTIRNITQEQ
jgi:hypothetical protein